MNKQIPPSDTMLQLERIMKLLAECRASKPAYNQPGPDKWAWNWLLCRPFSALPAYYATCPVFGVHFTGPVYEVRPIGWVRKADGRTTIEVLAHYEAALLGVDELDAVWVLYWFDRNDTPAHRAILQVHPHGDPHNPLRGVFATRAPVRPNLIALSRCPVISVQGNIIEIDDIDALADTPVLDIKP